jgi:hypothetical protein
VAFKNRILIAGINEKGGVIYDFDFKFSDGEFYAADLSCKTQVQFVQYISLTHLIEMKEHGYSNGKKIKGELIINAYLVYAKFNTMGKLISKNAI